MKISVIGGGYVGLISASGLAECGHDVTIIEIDADKVDMINNAQPPIFEYNLKELLNKYVGKSLIASTSYESIAESEVSLICVGTPSLPDGSADISYILSAAQQIGDMRKTQSNFHVVTVKSTVPPGTTKNFVLPAVLKQSEKQHGQIGFAVNPEFLREGRALEDFLHPDRIVIGSEDNKSGEIIEKMYSGLDAPVLRTHLTAAEMIKYTSNALLATKISFANEIGNICKTLSVDVYDVMKGVGMDHRLSPHFLNAGCGFGGSCFPKDVSALASIAKDIGEEPHLLNAVLQVNKNQPLKMISLLEAKTGNLSQKKIAVLGLAFKDFTDDIRESRAITIIQSLLRKGAIVSAYDPMANENMKEIFPEIIYCTNARSALIDADGCLVVTEWPEFSDLNEEFHVMKRQIIIDGRRILQKGIAEGICW